MFFKNLRVYKISEAFKLNAEQLNQELATLAFNPDVEFKTENLGFMPPAEHASHELVHAIDGQYLICLKVTKKVLPAAVVKEETNKKVAEISERQGYKVGRKQAKEIKESVVDELLPKAFSAPSLIFAWLNTKDKLFAVDSASNSKVDFLFGALSKCLNPFPMLPLFVNKSPATAMTEWLAEQEAPDGFSIDQGAEFTSSSELKASVSYKNQSVGAADVEKNIDSGKLCTRLDLTFDDKLSFVLTDSLDIKRVKPLDILIESKEQAESQAEVFDSDFTLMAAEYTRLIKSLINALDGEKPQDVTLGADSANSEIGE